MAANFNSPILSLNPASGETVGSFKATDLADFPAIIARARGASKHWSATPLAARKEFIRKAYREFYNHRDELAELISAETGKPLCEALSSEILPVLDCFKYYLRNITKLLRTSPITPINPLFKLRRGVVRYEPLGVIAVISPWNYPLLLSMQHIVPALLVGNVIVHKPSELTTLTALKVREIFDQSDLPEALLQVVTGFSEVGEALVNSKLDKIFFTGSTLVGKKIYEQAAKNLIPVNMELGGSDPMIVLQDANLEKAINAALWGAFTNAGQACVSVERVYVHDSIHQVFLEELVEKAKHLSLNRPGPEQEIGCMITETHRNNLLKTIDEMVQGGATVHLGGTQEIAPNNSFLAPTILTGISDQDQITDNEFFGPVLTIEPFSTEEEAIDFANRSRFGLSASIWTEDVEKGKSMAAGIEAGAVHVNEVLTHLAQFEAPYTGYKESGLGVSRGPWGIQELVRTKYITTDRSVVKQLLKPFLRRFVDNDVWWFHYGAQRGPDFQAFLVFLHSGSIFSRIKAGYGAARALLRRDYM